MLPNIWDNNAVEDTKLKLYPRERFSCLIYILLRLFESDIYTE